MQPPSITNVTLATYLRLRHWRGLQQLAWPGLFSDSIGVPQPSSKSATTRAITVESFRNTELRILIDAIPVIICDGCGALQQLEASHGSSDTTLPPSNADFSSLFILCTLCTFPTPLAHLRTLLSLPSCGPHLPTSLALAILVEAASLPNSLDIAQPSLRAWLLDSSCRNQGLHLLLGAIGAREEQLFSPNPSESDHLGENDFSLIRENTFGDIQRAELFLQKRFTSSVVPTIPFSVKDVRRKPVMAEEGREAASLALHFVNEAIRIWKECQSQPQNRRHTLKMNMISRKFSDAQARARIFNHVHLKISETHRETQERRTAEGPSRGESQKTE